ncbi:hypothetical protein STEG23_003916, partial [Scotinomys teguina]
KPLPSLSAVWADTNFPSSHPDVRNSLLDPQQGSPGQQTVWLGSAKEPNTQFSREQGGDNGGQSCVDSSWRVPYTDGIKSEGSVDPECLGRREKLSLLVGKLLGDKFGQHAECPRLERCTLNTVQIYIATRERLRDIVFGSSLPPLNKLFSRSCEREKNQRL